MAPRAPAGCKDDWTGHGVNTWDYYEYKHDGSTHLVDPAQYRAARPFPAPPVRLDPVSKLLPKVLATVGASRPSRDPIDRRIAQSVRDRTGTSRGHTNGPWPDLAAGAPPPPASSNTAPKANAISSTCSRVLALHFRPSYSSRSADASLAGSSYRVVQGHDGVRSRTYRVVIENGVEISARPIQQNSPWLTLLYSFAPAVLIIALVVNSGFKGRGVMRAVMLVPWAIPTVISAALWRWIFAPDGVANALIPGQQVIWTAEGFQAWFAVVVADVWKTAPFIGLLVLAGLQIIPAEVYEAAKVDGASAWRQFWQITLPLVRPALVVAVLFRLLDGLRMFDRTVHGHSPGAVQRAPAGRPPLLAGGRKWRSGGRTALGGGWPSSDRVLLR